MVSGAYVSSLFKGWKSSQHLYHSRVNEEQDALRVKVEVKLPSTPFRRYLSISIGQGNSKLDELQDINVATHRLVMIIR